MDLLWFQCAFQKIFTFGGDLHFYISFIGCIFGSVLQWISYGFSVHLKNLHFSGGGGRGLLFPCLYGGGGLLFPCLYFFHVSYFWFSFTVEFLLLGVIFFITLENGE